MCVCAGCVCVNECVWMFVWKGGGCGCMCVWKGGGCVCVYVRVVVVVAVHFHLYLCHRYYHPHSRPHLHRR